MKVLVTGATGFVGSHLCRRLVRAGFEVTALRRPTSDIRRLDGLNLPFRTADLRDVDAVGRAVQGHDAVIHAGAHIGGSERESRVNVDGTRAVAGACREHAIGRLVHVSSVAAVGIPPRGTIADEQFPFNLESSGLHYHLSKKRAEEAVQQEIARGLDGVIVNPSYIFGPHGKVFRGGDLIDKLRRSFVVPYLMGGLCPVHVDDVSAGILAVLEHGRTGERYILGGENLTYKEAAQQIALAFGVRRLFLPLWPIATGAAALVMESWGKLRHQEPRISYEFHRWASHMFFYSSAKAERALGYSARPFSAILREYVALAGANQAKTLSP